MNFTRRFVQTLRIFRQNYPKYTVKTSATSNVSCVKKKNYGSYGYTTLAAASIFSWNPFKNSDDDNPESKLIDTIKRSILMIEKGEHKKAEQMLHLALRMAQDLQSKDGVTYVYDVLANLAMEVKDYVKAEKLYTDVMRRLLSEGKEQDDNQILHMSAKIAQMAHLQEHIEKASDGFKWTLTKIEEKLNRLKDDKDLLELWGLTKCWYGQFLMDNDKFPEAKKYLTEAYEIYTNIHGAINYEAVMMLNNLGVVCMQLNDDQTAEEYLQKAIELSKEVPGMVETGVFYANLGIVYMKKGLTTQAKSFCSMGWRMGMKSENKEAVQQADYCLEQIKLVMQGQ